jgi:hypothetical protein
VDEAGIEAAGIMALPTHPLEAQPRPVGALF